MRVILFEIRGQFAHWRKWFTTTSALTYSFPPRTALLGMLGAVLGVPREELPDRFPLKDTRTAVCPLGRIVKDHLPQTWVQSPVALVGRRVSLGEGARALERFQVELEVIRYPRYLVAFWSADTGLIAELADRLKEKRWVYTPYLGILGFLADIVWRGMDEAIPQQGQDFDLQSVLPLGEGIAASVEAPGVNTYIREERVPLEVLPGRRFRHAQTVYWVHPIGRPLHVRCQHPLAYHLLRTQGIRVRFLEEE